MRQSNVLYTHIKVLNRRNFFRDYWELQKASINNLFAAIVFPPKLTGLLQLCHEVIVCLISEQCSLVQGGEAILFEPVKKIEELSRGKKFSSMEEKHSLSIHWQYDIM